MSYLGLDLGTGGCIAVAFSQKGEELASSFQEYSILHPHKDWAEIDPNEVINKCFYVIKEVNSLISDPIVSMSISSQGEAFIPVDENGQALGNAMVSSDSRARDISVEWSENFGKKEIYRITGHTAHPLFTLFKILWIKRNNPYIWKKSKYFFCFEDFFHFRVGLNPKISWSMAGRTMMFDVTKHQWSDEILNAIELEPERLATPAMSGEIVGTIDHKKGKGLGFKNPVMVVAGGHDQTCAALGAGVVESGMCMYATGQLNVSVRCWINQVLRKN